MIVIMKRGTPQKEIDKLSEALIAKGVEVNPVVGKDLTILGLRGHQQDRRQLDRGEPERHAGDACCGAVQKGE